MCSTALVLEKTSTHPHATLLFMACLATTGVSEGCLTVDPQHQVWLACLIRAISAGYGG